MGRRHGREAQEMLLRARPVVRMTAAVGLVVLVPLWVLLPLALYVVLPLYLGFPLFPAWEGGPTPSEQRLQLRCAVAASVVAVGLLLLVSLVAVL